jgi:hypothetical protein
VPDHVPWAADSVSPSVVVPEIVGSSVLTGAAAETDGLASLVTVADPLASAAVTTTRIVDPTSPAVSS